MTDSPALSSRGAACVRAQLSCVHAMRVPAGCFTRSTSLCHPFHSVQIAPCLPMRLRCCLTTVRRQASLRRPICKASGQLPAPAVRCAIHLSSGPRATTSLPALLLDPAGCLFILLGSSAHRAGLVLLKVEHVLSLLRTLQPTRVPAAVYTVAYADEGANQIAHAAR